mmetsp:Transcript_20179/g.48810  ORF Transcript_20179/g.48810 Transcript_20179/m.48810 type:complete len:277 (-) Transcript_20179:150-980(-)
MALSTSVSKFRVLAHGEIQRVRIHFLRKIVHLVRKRVAHRGVCGRGEDAAGLNELVPEGLRHHVVRRVGRVLAPVAVRHPRQRVPNRETLESGHALVDQALCQRGEVVPSVGFRRQVEVSVLVLREPGEEALDEERVVLRRLVVAVGDVGVSRREPDPGRLLDKHHVCNLVPGVGVNVEASLLVGAEGTLLAQEPCETGAARSSVSPEDDRVRGGCELRFDEPVEEGPPLPDVDVSGELAERDARRKARQGMDLILGRLGREGDVSLRERGWDRGG